MTASGGTPQFLDLIRPAQGRADALLDRLLSSLNHVQCSLSLVSEITCSSGQTTEMTQTRQTRQSAVQPPGGPELTPLSSSNHLNCAVPETALPSDLPSNVAQTQSASDTDSRAAHGSGSSLPATCKIVSRGAPPGYVSLKNSLDQLIGAVAAINREVPAVRHSLAAVLTSTGDNLLLLALDVLSLHRNTSTVALETAQYLLVLAQTPYRLP